MLNRISKNQLDRSIELHEQKIWWRNLFCIVAVVVVFCTTYALIMPAITMERTSFCGKSEHVHSDECYTTHIVEDDDMETNQNPKQIEVRQLILCELEEHEHTAICFADTRADLETSKDWEDTIKGIPLGDSDAENLIAIAKSQLGYEESKDNYILNESGNIKGYTRYGEWYGDPYGDWSAMYVSFCLNYAGISDFPLESNCEYWSEILLKENHSVYREETAYMPACGDLVFFDTEQTGNTNHVGIVESVFCEEQKIKVIEGDSMDCVREVDYNLDDNRIVAYVQLMDVENETLLNEEIVQESIAEGTCNINSKANKEGYEEAVGETINGKTVNNAQETGESVLVCEGEDYAVSVSFTKEANIPQNAQLVVREIRKGSEEYEDYYQQTKEQINFDGVISFCRFFDVSFVLDGEEIEPEAPVEVNITYEEEVPVSSEDDCNAIHFAEDGTELLEVKIEQADNGEQTFLFTQNSFSVVGTVVTSFTLSDGQYIFYKDGYAIGVDAVDSVVAVPVTVNNNGHVIPVDKDFDIDQIIWNYMDGGLYNTYSSRYLSFASGVSLSASKVETEARIINNTVRFTQSNYYGYTIYLGFSNMSYTTGGLFENGDYFMVAKVTTVEDEELEIGDLQILDNIKLDGCLKPILNSSDVGGNDEISYTWYKSMDGGITWNPVERKKITGNLYNVAEDGTWLNVTLDGGAEARYKVAIESVNESQLIKTIESNDYVVPYFDELKNGDFEKPYIDTNVNDAEHYQPFLPNGTAEMIWKTTASDAEIEFISVASNAFQQMSERWHLCEDAAHGVQYVELNANMSGALYQDVLTVPGSTMYWQLAHRGRGEVANSSYERDTMYVICVSTEMAETYNITTQEAVNDVITNPSSYPGAQVWTITDDNREWYYHSDSYEVPEGQYLTRYFFVAGPTAYDNGGSGNLAYTIGNHLDDVSFSTEVPAPLPDTTSLLIKKTIIGLSEEDAKLALDDLTFDVSGTTIKGTEFVNFMENEDGSFSATYVIQNISIENNGTVTKTITEDANSADYGAYERITNVTVNGESTEESNAAVIELKAQEIGTVDFTNQYSKALVNLTLEKADENNTFLKDATFELAILENDKWVILDTVTTDSSGTKDLKGLRQDTLYRLTETVPPDGYILLTDPIYFKVATNGVEFYDEEGNILAEKREDVFYTFYGTLKVINKPGYALPETGGYGIYYHMFIGVALIVASIFYVGYQKHKRERGSEF